MKHWAVRYCLLGNILTLPKIKLGAHLSVGLVTSLDKNVTGVRSGADNIYII